MNTETIGATVKLYSKEVRAAALFAVVLKPMTARSKYNGVWYGRENSHPERRR